MSARTGLVLAALLCTPIAAQAQSSLGIRSGGATIGVTSADAAGNLGFAAGWLDVAITGAHGLQFSLALDDTIAGALGRFDAHLYLAPHEAAKYGFFATASDLDGAGFTLGLLGAEGMVALGPTTTAEFRSGIGIARRDTAPTSLDFVFLGGSVTHALGPDLDLGLAAEIAEYDEAALQAIGYTLTVEARYRPGDSPLALTAALGVSGLEGRDGAPAESFISLGLTYSFGAQTGTGRPFRRATPYAPLALRGLF